MRASDFELQRSENDCAREGEHRTNLRRVFLPLCRRAETWAEEGFRAQETAEGCAFAMHPKWLCKKHYPLLIFVCWVKHLLPGLPIQLRQLLYAVHWLFEHQNQHLCIVSKLWKEVHVVGYASFDHPSVHARHRWYCTT